MEILPRKYTTLFVGAVLLVLIGIMAYSLWARPTPQPPTQYEQELSQIRSLSTSDETADIETDLQDTDLSGLDKELQDIEAELDQPD